MRALAHRLRQQGFHPSCFAYASMQSVTMAAVRLADCIGRRGPVHLVGHSLGGLVIEQMLQMPDAPLSQVGRVVMLGTPLAGSGVAAKARRLPFGRRLLGANAKRLMRGAERRPIDVPIGMIAGDRSLGLGQIVQPGVRGDGTVALEETQWPGLDAHCTLPVTHSSMLWSGAVAREVGQFLAHGQFRIEHKATVTNHGRTQ
jgi:hypothetical protein